MDHKMAAANDPQETSLQNEQSRTQIVTSEYLASLLVWLESFTGRRLSEQDMTLWTERLKKYPMWKLDKATEYTGTLSNDFFQYLDRLQPKEKSFVALPAPDPSKREKEGIRRVLKYCQDIAAAETHEERVKLEQEFAKDMREKFNHPYQSVLK